MASGSDLPRPFLTVHVFGSKGCGKTSFKTQWFDSSQCRAVSEIADVHIRIQVRGRGREGSYSGEYIGGGGGVNI